MNDNFKMSSSHYTDNELHLMSYQDLRRLSILLQLPANIKKEYMISMIQAHQRGDNALKTAIANKIMEERKVKRLSKKKQSKSGGLGSSVDSQQIPTDLSVSTQHEFETRFSYVAHYSKDELSSGVSRIIKQEAEVSRRNRSILQQPRKPTRKLSTVGRTEIMLPRNHSLTTPVRLMPQYERGFPPPGDYEPMSGLSNTKSHFQDINYNYHFHGEYSNSLIPTTSQDLYRSEPYWHAREVYNNSLMPILSSLLTPSSVTINSSSYALQYTPTNSVRGPTSFQQGVYENYIKSNSLLESQAFQSSANNATTLVVNNHHMFNNSSSSSTGNINRGSYLFTKGDVDFEITSTTSEVNCQHCSKREELVVKNPNENQDLLDFYTSRNPDVILPPQTAHGANIREVDTSQYHSGYFRIEKKNPPHEESTAPHHSFESSSVVAYRTAEIVETDVSDHEAGAPIIDDYESSYTEDDKLWEASESGLKKLIGRNCSPKENLMEGFLTSQTQRSFMTEVSDTSAKSEEELNDKLSKSREKESDYYVPNFTRCRYTSGHNKYPEAISDSNRIPTLPSFLSAFCSHESYNRAYSVCKNSFTGTTETHLNPIMSCSYPTQFPSTSNAQQIQVNSPASGSQIQRQWYYPYPESQVPFPMEPANYSTWNEYPNQLDNKVTGQNYSHSVQVVKCRTHGCHYVYSVTNPCD